MEKVVTFAFMVIISCGLLASMSMSAGFLLMAVKFLAGVLGGM